MNRAVILLLMALSGCRAVGPDYARPQNALPGSWGEQAGGGRCRWPGGRYSTMRR